MGSQETYRWSDSAFYWEKHRTTIEQMYGPLTEAMIQLGDILTGSVVLDVAGGTGEPSLTIKRYDRGKKIIVTDLSIEMVKCAKAESERRNLERIAFCRCTGVRLPFKDRTFDRVISRLGIMFFPDVVAGLKEMLRTTQDGGRIVIAVWHKAEANPMFSLVTEHLNRYIPPPSDLKGQDDPFRFAPPGTLTAVAEQAGGKNIREQEFDFLVQAPITHDQFFDLRTELSETLRQKIKLMPEAQRRQLRAEIEESVMPYFTETAMSFPAKTVLMTFTK